MRGCDLLGGQTGVVEVPTGVFEDAHLQGGGNGLGCEFGGPRMGRDHGADEFDARATDEVGVLRGGQGGIGGQSAQVVVGQ